MTKWEYCRIDLVTDDPEGDYVVITRFMIPATGERAGERIPVYDESVVEGGDARIAVALLTLFEQVDRLGSEGWEAFHVVENSKQWHFKRPYTDDTED